MTSKATSSRSQKKSLLEGADSLYSEFLRLFYDEGDRRGARKIAPRLVAFLNAEPEFAASIRGEEVRSLLAELRGDFLEAIRSREAEVRKILELHALALKDSTWEYVSRQYDHADVSDRLDILAILYDRVGDLTRAKATLQESRDYCASHGIPFDGQEILDELRKSRRTRPQARAKRSGKLNDTVSTAKSRRGT